MRRRDSVALMLLLGFNLNPLLGYGKVNPLALSSERVFFRAQAQHATSLIHTAYFQLKGYLLRIVEAYINAYDNHSRLVDEHSKSTKLADDLVISSILAAAGWIPFGNVAGIIINNLVKEREKGNIGEFIVRSAKDMIMFAGRTTGSLAASALAPNQSTGTQVMPKSPLLWKTQLEIRLSDEMKTLFKIIGDWIEKTLYPEKFPEFKVDFDPVTIVKASLKIAETDLAALAPGDQNTMMGQFEKAFWITWLQEYGYVEKILTRLIGPSRNISNKIERRCNELGISASEIMEHSHVAARKISERIDEEIRESHKGKTYEQIYPGHWK